MQVETFEAISSDPSKGDNALLDELKSGEAVELIERLGLEGQKSLLVEREAGDGEKIIERFPYRRMTVEEDKVYGVLMPEKTKIGDYKDGPIPLRVLQVAAHARDLFDEPLVVWHPKGAIDDPILVGIKQKEIPGSPHKIREVFLLARWGNELLPFTEMAAKAREMWIAKALGAASKGLSEINAFLLPGSAEVAADAYFSGGVTWGNGYPTVHSF